MNHKTVLATAAALTMTVAGGVSALLFTLSPAPSAASSAPVNVEYVDEAGMPIDAPTTSIEASPTDTPAPASPQPSAYEEPSEEAEEEHNEEEPDEGARYEDEDSDADADADEHHATGASHAEDDDD